MLHTLDLKLLAMPLKCYNLLDYIHRKKTAQFRLVNLSRCRIHGQRNQRKVHLLKENKNQPDMRCSLLRPLMGRCWWPIPQRTLDILRFRGLADTAQQGSQYRCTCMPGCQHRHCCPSC